MGLGVTQPAPGVLPTIGGEFGGSEVRIMRDALVVRRVGHRVGRPEGLI